MKEEMIKELVINNKQTYKDGYLMAVKHLREVEASKLHITLSEALDLLEVSASTIDLT